MADKTERNQQKPEITAPANSAGVGPELIKLARTSKSASAFWRQALGLIGEQFTAKFGLIHISLPAGRLDEYWHSGPASPKFWEQSVRRLHLDCMASRSPKAQLFGARESGGSPGGCGAINDPNSA